MKKRVIALSTAALLVCMIPAASQADLVAYNQDFESLNQLDTAALANDGWSVFGNVSDPDGGYLYGYGPFVAPNDGFGFCQIDILQGGPTQGVQQLSVFSDYNNADHAVGNLIESNTYQEWTVGAADVGYIWTLAFDAKMGNLEGGSTALAFIKTLDPGAGYALTNFISVDMTTTPVEWQGYTLEITIDSSLVGQLLQIGFSNTATLYEGAGIFYDNVDWQITGDVSSVPDATAGAVLKQNYPNPFNPSTRIDFALDQPENVDVSVYDLAGRRVATLQRGPLGAGDHHVTWNGRTDNGAPAATGHYRYVLTTGSTRVSRGMVLLK